MISRPRTVKLQNFVFMDFEDVCCLELTEYYVAAITWPQYAKIREIFFIEFLAPGLFQNALKETYKDFMAADR